MLCILVTWVRWYTQEFFFSAGTEKKTSGICFSLDHKWVQRVLNANYIGAGPILIHGHLLCVLSQKEQQVACVWQLNPNVIVSVHVDGSTGGV